MLDNKRGQRCSLHLETLEDRAVPAGIVVDYRLTQDWGSGFQGQIKMENQRPSDVSTWTLEFDWDARITSIWDASIVSHVGNHYVITHSGWNEQLTSGGSVSFGFVAAPGSPGSNPDDYLFNGDPIGNEEPTLPSLTIDDVTIAEGNSATKLATFQLRLSQASTVPVTVRYATVDDSAQAGSDYNATTGQVTFDPGQTTQTIQVAIVGDGVAEPTETFRLVLSDVQGATLARSEATGTILDDDAPPASGDFVFRVDSDWGTGFTGNVTARNSTGATLRDWVLEFDFAGEITSIWNANLVSRTGNHYVLTHSGWNDTIAPGASISFGFVASPGNGAVRPTNFFFRGASNPGGGGGGSSNQPPVAVNDYGRTTPDTPLTLPVLANDHDPEGDSLSIASFTQPEHGTVTQQADGTLLYAPASGQIGSDAFQYTITDGQGGTATATVLLTVADSLGEQGVWPAHVFAPYVDTTLWPTFDFVTVAREQGLRYFTLAFVVADPSGLPAWGGYSVYGVGDGGEFDTKMRDNINALRDMGGDVMVSFGGASNQELALVIKDVEALKSAYRKVIDTYGLRRIDFDIEGAATADRASIDRRSRALAELQTEYSAAGKDLEIWLTLPVLPTGLTHDGVYVVESALRHGVKLSGVNIMAMDYGDSAAPNPQGRMGDYAIQAAESLHAQLTTLYGSSLTDAQIWRLIGVTPMIGLNDVTTEVFDQQEARELLAFAQQKGLAMLSMWSINRDRQHANGQINFVDLHSSSILQSPYEFSLLFHVFTGS